MTRFEREKEVNEHVDAELAEFLWKEFNADIGAALKKARDARRMLQSQVAKLMGIQQSRVSQIESAKGMGITLDVLARYVAALGYRLDVDVVDPETDALISSLPVVPMSFMSVEEVEQRSSVTSVSMPLLAPMTEPTDVFRRHFTTTITSATAGEGDLYDPLFDLGRTRGRENGRELAAAA